MCEDVTAAPAVQLDPVEQERHAVFLLLAMALVHDGWTVEKSRPELVAAYSEVEPRREFPDYAGHNIGAILVNGEDEVVSFALNRNVALNSTLEHAEARAVRNAIRIANADAGPQGPKKWSFGSLLKDDRVYTTLEPCAQCAGIIDLANARAVVFAQDDPGQHHIVDVIYNLQRGPGSHPAPLPVRANFFEYWDALAAADADFQAKAAAKGALSGPTSFLETVEAYKIFRDAARRFADFEPGDKRNAAALRNARDFRDRWSAWIADGVGPA